MKKLLLYLMALVVFGTASVDSFATKYLRIVTEESGYANGNYGSTNTTDPVYADVVMNMAGGSKDNVAIGTGKFAVGVYDSSTNKITWYAPQGTSGIASLEPNIGMKMVAKGQASYLPGFTASEHAILKVADGKASEGETFLVDWNDRVSELTLYADYSKYTASFKGGNEGKTYLTMGGDATFDVKSDGNGKFNIWITDTNGKEIALNIGDINQKAAWGTDPKAIKLTGINFTQGGNKEVSGLAQNTFYRVTVGYGDRTFYIEELPNSLYLWGSNLSGVAGWTANDIYRLTERDGIYSIVATIPGDTQGYFGINCGGKNYILPPNDEGGRNHDWDGNDVIDWYSLSEREGAIHNTGGTAKFSIAVTVDENGVPDKIRIERVDNDADANYEGWNLITTYMNGAARHRTQRTELVNGQWVTTDNGNGDFVDNDKVIYDGLRLGYDNFYIQTYDPSTGSTAYWAISEELIPGNSYKLQQVGAQGNTPMGTLALQKGMKVANNGFNNVNSRYNVIWNWTTKNLTVELNEEWTANPNQMYLYKLDDGEDWRTLTLANVNEALEVEGQNKVYVLPLLGNADAVYQARFDAADDDDMPEGTRFCIVGRTGQVYNILGENGQSFEIGAGWEDPNEAYHMEMTRSDSQEPAKIANNYLVDTDFVVSVRANYTSTEEGLQNAYVISFQVEEEAPVKFLLTKEGDSTEHEILPGEDGNYSLTGFGLENGKNYTVTAVFENGREVKYGPIDGKVIGEIDSYLNAITNDGEEGGNTEDGYKDDETPKIYVYAPNWEKLGLYGWKQDSPEVNGSWPGKEITESVELDGKKYFIVRDLSKYNGYNLIFNNYKYDGDEDKQQVDFKALDVNGITAFEVANNKCDKIAVPVEVAATGASNKLYIKVSNGWNNVGLYAWADGKDTIGGYAGSENLLGTEEIDGETYYVIPDLSVYDGYHLILTNGENWNGQMDLKLEEHSGSGIELGPNSSITDITISGVAAPVQNSTFQVGTSMFATNCRIYVQWNNGKPMMQIRKFGERKTVRVYFIDRAGWGDIQCYNYTDGGVKSKEPSDYLHNDWTESPDANAAKFKDAPKMHVLGNEQGGLYTKLGISGKTIYYWDLEVDENDGVYSRPKVIFFHYRGYWDNKDQFYQTNNLYLVDGGIYTNDSKAVNGLIANPATVYLPRMQFTYMQGLDADVYIYPNEFYSCEYNVIYLEDERLYKWATEADGRNIGVSITYDRDGDGVKEMVVTGVAGTHIMEPVTIGNRHFMRVAIAEDVIPNDVKVDLSFWNVEDPRYIQEKTDADNHHAAEKHTDAAAPLNETCTYTYPNGDTYTYTGAHFYCANSLCSLNFTNVEYKDGNIYRRYIASDGTTTQDPIVRIVDEVTPYAFYIVPNDVHAFETAQINGALETTSTTIAIEGKANVQGYKMTYLDPNNEDKLVYLLPGVLASASFRFIADVGTENNPYYIEYSGVDNGNGTTPMLPGQPYKYFNGLTNNFTIDPSSSAYAKSYEVRVSWTDSDVSITANKTDADFEFVAYNDGQIETLPNKVSYLLPAHTDECVKQGSETHLTPIYFRYAYGYDRDADGNLNDSRLKNLSVKIVRDKAYDRYFPENTVNKVARVVTHSENSAYLKDKSNTNFIGGDEGVFEIVAPSQIVNGTEVKGLARIYVIGYTAVKTSLVISQTATSNSFAPSSATLPIRIYPTFESVGFTINNFTINVAHEEGKDPLFQQNEMGIYTATLTNEPHTSLDNPGQPVNFGDRLQFHTTLADNGKSNWEWLQIKWCENPDFSASDAEQETPRQYRAAATSSTVPTVVTNPKYGQTVLLSDVDTDPYAGDHTTPESNTKLDLGDYNIYNAPQVPITSDGSASEKKSFYVKLTQNGINSPAYRLDVQRGDANDPNIPTEVEEILGADNDAEAEYYNLNGVKVDGERLEPGIYVKVQGSKSEKIYIR